MVVRPRYIVRMRRAQLLSASCTTGWADWIHSELWLFEDALLVAKTDFGRTVSHGFGPTVGAAPIGRDFSSADIARIESRARTSRRLDGSTLTSARFRTGRWVGGLDLCVGHTKHTLMWFANDHPEGALREALTRWGTPTT